jgi:hypothetical protein
VASTPRRAAGLSEIRDPIGGSQSIANAFGTVGVDDPANVQANTTGERIARGVGEGRRLAQVSRACRCAARERRPLSSGKPARQAGSDNSKCPYLAKGHI